MLFSHRKGFKPVKKIIQIDSMDNDLKNGLWNVLTLTYWKQGPNFYQQYSISNTDTLRILLNKIWYGYFKKPLDTLDDHWPKTYEEIRKYFFSCKWNEIYDFIEFIANNYPEDTTNSNFMNVCNSILERELSAYRFVGKKITQITDEEEIAEIEETLKTSLKPIKDHLERALNLFADRKSPDYRNSIKESISAVEAICRLITGKPKATLGQALKEIEKKVEIHTALKQAVCISTFFSISFKA